MPTTYQFVTTWICAHIKSQRGATLVEYSLLIALLVLVCAAAISRLNNIAGSRYSQTAVQVGQ